MKVFLQLMRKLAHTLGLMRKTRNNSMRKRKREKSKWNPASWGKAPKRILAMGLAVALVGGVVDLSPLAADARTQTTETQSVITAFQELSQDIREQQLPLGAKESDIHFPDTLTVTLQQTVTIFGKQETESEEETVQESITGEDSENQNRETKETTETQESGENATEESQEESDNSSGEKKGQQESLENPETENLKAGSTPGDTPQTEKLEDSQEQNQEENQAEQPEEARNAGSFQTLSWKDFFPRKLVVQAAESDASSGDTDNTQNTAENVETTKTVEKESTLENIRWELDKEESDAEEFDSSEASNGFCYVYTPVLPDTDKDGNTLVVGDVELPAIYVLVGEYEIATLEGNAVIEVNGVQYATIDAAIEANSNKFCMNNCNIKLLQDGTLSIPIRLYGTTTLDLNGHTFTNGVTNDNYLLKAENASGTETACNLTIKSSIDGGKILTGRNWGTGTLTVDSNASCTIEKNVTIEDNTVLSINNYGTLTVKEGATLLNNNPNQSKAVILNTRGNAILEGGSYTGDRNIKVKDGTLAIKGGTYDDVIDVWSDGTLVISGGTFNKNITLPQGRTLQDCMKEGYTLKALDSADTIDMDSNTLTVPAKAEAAKIYFTKHPTLGADQASLLEGYAADETATLTVTTKGTGTLTYQWHVKKTLKGGTTTDETISGATVSSYQIPEGLQAGTYEYYCVASYDGETAKSKSVTFTVTAGYVQTQIGGTKKSYASLKAAWQDITDAVKNDKGTAIILTFLEDITGESDTWTMDGTGKTADLTIDLNGKKVTCDAFTFQQIKVTLKNSDSKQEGELNATLNIQDKAALIAENITLQDISVQSGANAELKDSTTTNVVAGSATGSDDTVNAGISCRIDGGIHKNIKVNGGAKLAVTGEAKITDTLQAVHSVGKTPVRAEVTLSGGDYARIQVSTPNGGLEDASKGYAIVDMLAEGYAFYSLGMKTEVARPETSYVNLSVCKDDTQEDTGKAVVKLIVTKKDNTKNVFYFPGWTDTLRFLRNQKNAGNWKTLELVLLQDTTITQSEWEIKSGGLPSDLKITIHSKEDGNPCTLHAKNLCVLNFRKFEDVTLQNIKIDAGYIRLYQTIMTLEKNTEISNNTSTIIVEGGSLIVNDAKIGITSNSASTPIFLKSGQLRLENKDSILSVKEDTGRQVRYSMGNSSIIVGKTAKMPTVVANDDDIELNIFCNNPNEKDTPGRDAGSGKVKVWYPITLPESKDELLKSNPDTVKECDDIIYGLGWSSDTSVDQSITVVDTICSYQELQGSPVPMTDNKFKMPAAPVTLLNHKLDDNGKCANCGKTDLAVAYKKGNLKISGLAGRTYDSWPQTLTGITLTGTDGNMTTLTGPAYISGKELAQDSTNTANADLTSADYALVYENNINAYDKVQGESGFNEAKAPKVTITGRGSYTGTVEYYFTIGQGKLLTKDFKVNDNLTYNGKQQGVLQYGTLAYEADGTDADTPIKQAGMSGADTSISVSSGKTVETDGFTSIADPKISYSTDNGSTWTEIAQNNQDLSKTNYLVQDAGTYDFQVRVTDGNNAAPAAQSLTATIQPKSLTSNDIRLDNSQSITVYYTGKPIVPTNKDHAITDNNSAYVLEKGKDFTTSATNNTNKGSATLTFTGMGNYTGTLTDTFSIDYAFELAQTTASTDHWYNTDVPAVFGVNNTTGDTTDALKQLIYRSVTRADNTDNTELNSDVKLYSALQDAIADTNAGYTFTGEGKRTVTLYGRDTAKGYIANPIDITVQIDKTAPTWADQDGNTENYGIQIKNNWWRTLLNKVSFGTLYNGATLDMKIHANDKKNDVNEVSGINKYYYYVDTVADATDDMSTKTKAELDALAAQGEFQAADPDSGLFSGEGATISGKLSNSGNYVVYAYAVDKAGNKSDYICTEGLVVDNQAPVLTVKAPTQEQGTLKDDEATIMIHSDEAAELVYFYQSLSDESKQLSYVEAVNSYIDSNVTEDSRLPFATKKDGKWVAKVEVGDHTSVQVTDDPSQKVLLYCVELKEGQNSITLDGLNKARRADVWMVAIDKAGNITDTKTLNFTTTKAMPRITTLPQSSGVYGDTTADLTVTDGVAKYNDSEISGTWTVEPENTKLEVGTTKQCTVKFTPKDSGYAEAYVKVTPTITKRPITIRVADMTKGYKESMPEIAFDIPTSNIDGKMQLADGDTEETIKSSLQLVTEATADSDVGTYSFTVTSNSPNYEVTAEYYENLSDLVSTIKRQGTLTITQALGELTKETGYTDTKTVTYGDAPFSLNVTANHTESSIQYQVTDEKDADGNTISADEHIVSVSADGVVTINRAGSARIQISLPASKNYTASADLTVTVTAAQKDFAVPEQSRNYLYDRDSSDTIDLAALLPKDCGKASYTVSTKTDAVFETATITQAGKLSYKVKTGTIGTTGEIQVDIKTANYTIHGNSGSNGQITIKAALVDRKPVEPKTTVSVKNPTLTYGEPVSKLQFNSVTFVEQGTDQTVAGTLKWDDPDAVLDAGAQSVTWIFTPDNDEYQSETGTLTITVNRAAPQVEKVPVPGAYVYHPSNTLASDKAKAVLNAGAKVQGVVTGVQGRTVAGSWSWKEQSEVPNAGTHTYTAVFTPTDGANYETVEKPVTLTVEKAYVSIKDTKDSLQLPAYTHGEYLYNRELTAGSAYYAGKGEDYSDVDKSIAAVPGRYVWAAPETKVNFAEAKSTSKGDQAEYELEFIPDDTTNYAGTMETKNGWSGQKMAWVSLNKAANPPYRPSAQMTVANTCQKVGDVKLPQDWRWSGTDGDMALTENQPVSAVAEYIGLDAECYSNNSYSITIIRSTCDHAQTEIRNAKAATCSSEGSTGETWCTVCGVKLDDGYVLVKDSTNHTHLVSKVVKDATTTQEGIMSYSCADCGYYAEKAIAKLPSGGGSTSGGSSSGSGSTGSGNSGNTGGNNSKNTTGVAEIVTPPVTPVIAPGQGQTPQTPETTPATAPSTTKREPSQNGTGSRETTGEETEGELAKPFLRNADGKEGWEVITAEAKAAAEGENLVVDMNGTSVVPADVFEEIQGKDITIEFDLGNGITWKVNGLSVQEGKVGDIDFGVKLGADAADTIPVEVINQVTGERMSLNLSLAYEGTFGFEAVLTVKVGEDSAGLFANLFYYNEGTGKLEFMCAGEIREDGSVDLNFSHASEYTIVIDTKSMEQEMVDDGISTNAGDGPGQAGAALEEKNTVPDIAWILLLAAAVGIIAVGTVVLIYRRKSEEE